MRAADVQAALRRTYCQPEWSLFTEVTDGTGSAARRRADAIAMNMYPSRGLELRAFEIKVSRSDLKSELKDPSKAEAFAQFCNTFYLAIPKGLADGMDVPETWGVIEVYESGQSRITRRAEYNKSPIPPTVTFFAGLARAASKSHESEIQAAIGQEKAALREAHYASVNKEAEKRLDQLRFNEARNTDLLQKLSDALGKETSCLLACDDFVNTVAMVHKMKLGSDWDGFGRIHKDLNMVASTANAVAAMMAEHIETLTSAQSPENGGKNASS